MKTAWPPPYTLKKHPRSRHVKLKASLKNGLELVVPLNFNNCHIPNILETNKLWIEKQLQNIYNKLQAEDSSALPLELIFPALNETWKIHYIVTDKKKIGLLCRPNHEIVLMGDVSNKNECLNILIGWVKEHAQTHLPRLLKLASVETKLDYTQVSIRSQNSRWGSCTVNKTIQLNYKLLFLPAHLVKHILIHELCHTVHLNHSRSFWKLVAYFDSNWERNSKDSRRASKLLPAWLL